MDFSYEIINFINSNSDKNKKRLQNYEELNKILKKDHRINTPYPIPKIEIIPTYKTIELKYIKDKKYFVPVPIIQGGLHNHIYVFKSENFDLSEYI